MGWPAMAMLQDGAVVRELLHNPIHSLVKGGELALASCEFLATCSEYEDFIKVQPHLRRKHIRS